MDPNAPVLTNAEVLNIAQECVLGLWDVVDNLTRLRPAKSEHFSVTIFGSARIKREYALYEDVKRLACELAKLGCRIVTGGGPGLMMAANEGAVLGDPTNRASSVGIRVDLPFEQEANAFVGQVYRHKTFFTRLHHFMMISEAFVVVPGGIGSTLEALMVWQLLQVRRLYGTPLIMVGQMWADLVQWARTHMIDVQPQTADAVDMMIPRCVSNIDQAIDLIREQHARWNST
jgi:uncharacterized protein (TIGR00730 family)